MKLWNLKGKKVLIVDDFQEMRSMVQNMVAPLAPDVIKLAKNGEEAIEQLKATSFDIVFCDYNLGKGKDGQQVLEEAQHCSLLHYSSIFIMVTAENTSHMVMGAIDYLPDDYISKPFTRTLIHSRLKKLIDKKNSLLEVSRAIAEKNYTKAMSLCDTQLEQDPKNRMELLKTKGELLMLQGKYDSAADFYEELLEERDIPWAILALGQARYHQQQYFEAEEIFQSLIDDNSANVMAYDWLAKTLEALNETKRSQEVIADAVKKSPKSLLRQRKFAEIAYKNSDFETSESAYQEAINVGKHSCYKKPDDYTGLAKTMIKQDTSKNALAVIERMKHEFDENDMDMKFQANVTEGLIHKELGNTEESEKAINEAMAHFSKRPECISSNVAMDLASACLAMGKKDAADELTKYLVRNHHEDEAILDRTRELYNSAGLSDEGDTLIKTTTEEVININNQGAALLKQGKVEESIEFFMKAARGMPDNSIVNLNAAYSMIMQMQKTGKKKKYLPRTMKLLDHVHKIDPANKKYHTLLDMIQKLSISKKAA